MGESRQQIKQVDVEPEDSIFSSEQRYKDEIPWWRRCLMLIAYYYKILLQNENERSNEFTFFVCDKFWKFLNNDMI